MIRKDYKLKAEIKTYVQEFNKKMYYDIRNLTNQIRSLSSKVIRLEKVAYEPRDIVLCNKCKNKKKELDK